MDRENSLLVGRTGQITKEVTVVDVHKGKFGTDIRVKEDDGEEYWTNLNESIVID